MRKIIYTLIAGIFLTTGSAQTINRAHPPKPGPAPIIKLANPVTYKLSNGITLLIVENHKVPTVTASYTIDQGPVKEGDKAGVMDLMGGMLSEGTQKMNKEQFFNAIEEDGSNLSLGSNGGTISALDRYFDKGLMLLAQALQQPALGQAAFDKLKQQALMSIEANEKSVGTISSNVTGALLFGKNSALGEFETKKTIDNISLNDVKNRYQKYISPSRGYLTIVGDIKPEDAKKLAEKYFGNWKGANITLPAIADVPNPDKTEIDVIDVSNAVQSNIVVANVVHLPLDSKDYFAVLLANQILGGGADAYLFKDLREKHAYTYGAYSSISGGRFQTSFRASASVRNAVTDSAVQRFMAEIERIRTQKVSDTTLQNVKAEYNGNFALGTENPARIATFARNIMIDKLPADYYRTFLQKINAVTQEDVLRVAQKYFNHDNTRIIVTGKAEEILPGLKTLGYPVKLYDKEANPVTGNTPAVPAGVTAQSIVAAYIKAIGGETNLQKVNAVLSTGNMHLGGMTMPITQKLTIPNKTMMQISMNGNVVSQTVFNGTSGYQTQMGNKKAISGDELKKYTDQKGIFNQLYYNDGSFKLALKGTAKVEGKEAYKIEVTGPSGQITTEYYDSKTGYLVQSESSIESNNQRLSIVTTFDNYKQVDHVYFPFSSTLTISANGQSQEMQLTIDSIKINEGVSDSDFQ